MRTRDLFIALVAIGTLGAGCGRPGTSPTQNVSADLGGYVAWSGDDTVALAGVTVTLTDVDGDVETATTNAAGLWDMRNVKPGIYVERYALAGYEPFEASFQIDAIGENDVENAFVSRGTVSLDEAHLTATVAPYGVQLRNADVEYDGISGVSATYTGGDIVVTFSRPIAQPNTGDVFFYDFESGDVATANVDSAGRVFTIPAADIAAIDGGLGPATDTDPYSWTALLLVNGVTSFTPIHGESESMSAGIYMNVTP